MSESRCGHCGSGLPPGAETCPSCGVRLADLVAVMRTADAGLLAVLKTVLAAAGIEFVVQGEGALGLLPLGPLATGLTRNLLEATLYVSSGQAEEARELLRGLEPADTEPQDE